MGKKQVDWRELEFARIVRGLTISEQQILKGLLLIRRWPRRVWQLDYIGQPVILGGLS